MRLVRAVESGVSSVERAFCRHSSKSRAEHLSSRFLSGFLSEKRVLFGQAQPYQGTFCRACCGAASFFGGAFDEATETSDLWCFAEIVNARTNTNHYSKQVNVLCFRHNSHM